MSGRRAVALALIGALTALVLPSGDAAGQTPPALTVAGPGFTPGGQEIFSLDFASAPRGGLPNGIRRLCTGLPCSAPLGMVTKDGMPMLKASEASAFLITLAQTLPQQFTLEFDIVPKLCCPPPDLTVEGTVDLNQGPASAHLLWQADNYVAVIGGATDNQEFPIPEEIQVTLPGALTRVGVSVEGNRIRLYTNGQQIYEVQARFARGRYLRVFLGGEDDQDQAVHLARLRLATGGPAAAITALPATPAIGSITPMSPSTGAPAVTGIVAQVGPQGDASVSWSALQGATSYFVVRWEVNDPDCCKNFSPPAGMNRLTWADGVLPRAGTYGYRVYATTAMGISTGETQIAWQPTITALPAAAPATGSITPIPAVPAPTTIPLSPIAASGSSAPASFPAPRTVALAGITGEGPQTPVLVAPRTIPLSALTAVGSIRANTRAGSTEPAPQIIPLAGVSASGTSGAMLVPAPWTIFLAPVSGTGNAGGAIGVAPRTINLPAVTATGSGNVP